MKEFLMTLIKNAQSYMKMAELWALNSKAKRLKVGCLIIKNSSIISDGYNGTPIGFKNECEYKHKGKLITRPEVLHAESNAISKLAHSTQSSEGATLIITTAPCFECAKLIIQAQISNVYYKDTYRSNGGINLLKEANINICQIQ